MKWFGSNNGAVQKPSADLGIK